MYFFRSHFVGFAALAIGLFMSPLSICAQQSPQDCSKEVLFSFFPRSIVRQVLQNNQIPQDRWEGILNGLSEQDKDLINRVESKASQLSPEMQNDRKQKIQLLRDIMLQSFTDVMKDNGITDQKLIVKLLNEIQETRAKLFEACKKNAPMDQQRQQQDRRMQGPPNPPRDREGDEE